MSNFKRLYYYSPILVLILLFRASMDTVLALMKIGPFTAGALLNIVMLCILAAILYRQNFKVNRLIAAWLPFLAVTALSLVYTPAFLGGFKIFLVMITYMAAFAIPFHFIKSEQHYIECLKLVVYSAIIPIVAVSYELIFPAGSIDVNGFRFYSTFEHPNIFAFYLITVFSACFYVLKASSLQVESKFRRHCLYVLFLSLICIVGTKTRSAWVAIAILLFLWGAFRERKYLVYLILVCLVAFFIPGVQERILDLFQGNDTDAFINDYERLNSLAWRMVIWENALEKFWESPLLGFGFGSFQFYSGNFFLVESEGKGMGAHNTYVQILFELGMIGFLAMIYLFYRLFYALFKEAKYASENIIFLALFLAYSLVHYSDNIFGYLVFNWYFWFLIGSFLAYWRQRTVRINIQDHNCERKS